MRFGRQWFWPLVAVGAALAALAASLTALAVENPSSPSPLRNFPAVGGACLGLLHLFQDSGDPLDGSDVPLLLMAGASAVGCAAAFWAAKVRR
jgi:hypothetical protein